MLLLLYKFYLNLLIFVIVTGFIEVGVEGVAAWSALETGTGFEVWAGFKLETGAGVEGRGLQFVNYLLLFVYLLI